MLLFKFFLNFCLIFCSLTMIYPDVFDGGVCACADLHCLVFSELPRSVLYCLILIWGKFSVRFLKYCFYFFPLLLVSPLHVTLLVVIPQFLDIILGFLFCFFRCFVLTFQFWMFLLLCSKLRDSLLSHVLMRSSDTLFL